MITMDFNNFVHKFFNDFDIVQDYRLFNSYLNKSGHFDNLLWDFLDLIDLRNLAVDLDYLFMNSLDLLDNLLSLNDDYRLLFQDFNLFDLFCYVRDYLLDLLYTLFCIRLFFKPRKLFHCHYLLDHLYELFSDHFNLDRFLNDFLNNNQLLNDFVTRYWDLERHDYSFL